MKHGAPAADVEHGALLAPAVTESRPQPVGEALLPAELQVVHREHAQALLVDQLEAVVAQADEALEVRQCRVVALTGVVRALRLDAEEARTRCGRGQVVERHGVHAFDVDLEIQGRPEPREQLRHRRRGHLHLVDADAVPPCDLGEQAGPVTMVAQVQRHRVRRVSLRNRAVHERQAPALDLLAKGPLGGLDRRGIRVHRDDPVPTAQVVRRVQAVIEADVVDEAVVDLGVVGRGHRRTRAVFHVASDGRSPMFQPNIHRALDTP